MIADIAKYDASSHTAEHREDEIEEVRLGLSAAAIARRDRVGHFIGDEAAKRPDKRGCDDDGDDGEAESLEFPAVEKGSAY